MGKRVIPQVGTSLSTVKTHALRKLENESYSFFVDAMLLMKLPDRIKGRFYDIRRQHPEALPSELFNRAYPDFPLRLLAAPLSKSKEITRLDHLEGVKGGELSKLYLEMLNLNVEIRDATAIVMLIRLPYFRHIHCMHNVDPGFIKLWDQPGAIYSVKSEAGYRINLQPAEFFFGNPVVREIVSNYFENCP